MLSEGIDRVARSDARRLFLSMVKNPREEYVILMLVVRVWESCGSAGRITNVIPSFESDLYGVLIKHL